MELEKAFPAAAGFTFELTARESGAGLVEAVAPVKKGQQLSEINSEAPRE